eukprot:15331920-Ditylum_brightwellii.AAC.1
MVKPKMTIVPASKSSLTIGKDSLHSIPPKTSTNNEKMDPCCAKIKRFKKNVISKRPIYIERETAMPEDSWYNTYVEMENKREREALLETDTNVSAVDEKDALEMIRTYDASHLRASLYISQVELYKYHEVLEEVFKIKQCNKRLNSAILQLRQKCSQQMLRLRKQGAKKIHSMNRQIAQLKLEIAESKDHEDRHNVDIRKVQDDKKTLENQIEALRLKIIPAVPSNDEVHSSLRRTS